MSLSGLVRDLGGRFITSVLQKLIKERGEMENPMAKRVTDEQEQGEIGESQVHTHFLQTLGWKPRPLKPDLGEDFIVDIYDQGVSAGLAFFVQVKSSAKLSKFQLKTGNRDFSYPICVKDLNHWREGFPPVVIVIWDTVKLQGYWITVVDAIRQLDDRSPGWQNKQKPARGEEPTVNALIPQANELNKDGSVPLRHKLAYLLFPAFSQGKEMSIHLDFSFSKDAEGQAQHEAMERFWELGEGVSIDGRFIKGIRFPDWFERKFGKFALNPEGIVSMGPRYSDEIFRFRVTLLSPQGRALHRENIEVKAVRMGDSQVTFSNEHLPTPFSFSMVVPKEGYQSVNISLQGARVTAGEALKAYNFFENARSDGTLRIEILSERENDEGGARIEIPIRAGDFPETEGAFREVLTKMHTIETKTGVSFPVTQDGFTRDDWQAIYEVAEIVETGRLVSRFSRQEQIVRGPVGANDAFIRAVLDSWRKPEPVLMEAEVGRVDAHILGVTVPLGRLRTRLRGDLDVDCARKLEEIEQSGIIPESVEFVFVNGEQEQEFAEWLVESPTLPPMV